jgi:hypothetical protein
MTGTIKTACTINLMIAIGAVSGHVIYDFWSGLIHHYHFLGTDAARVLLHGPVYLPVWLIAVFFGSVIFAVIELIILLTYFLGRVTEHNLRRHRIFCGWFGAFGLYLLLISIIIAGAYSKNVFAALGITPSDTIVVIYVAGSHLVYALSGGEVSEPVFANKTELNHPPA